MAHFIFLFIKILHSVNPYLVIVLAKKGEGIHRRKALPYLCRLSVDECFGDCYHKKEGKD